MPANTLWNSDSGDLGGDDGPGGSSGSGGSGPGDPLPGSPHPQLLPGLPFQSGNTNPGEIVRGAGPFEFPEMMFPEMPDFAAMYEEQMAAYEEAVAAQQRAAGIKGRDTYYANYLTAVQDAISFVDADNDQKASAANLMGVDFAVSDDERGTQISDYFAAIWSEGHQTQLQGMIDEWGEPKGFTGWKVERGDPSKYQNVEEGSIDQKESVIGQPSVGSSIIPDDEETIGSGKGKNLLNI